MTYVIRYKKAKNIYVVRFEPDGHIIRTENINEAVLLNNPDLLQIICKNYRLDPNDFEVVPVIRTTEIQV